jgi:hypothetical protein
MNNLTAASPFHRGVAEKRRYLNARYNPGRPGRGGVRDIENVLVINSASRSGSSFLHSLLARHPGVISLNGEEIVFHKLHGIGAVKSEGDSDRLPPDFKPDKDVLAEIAGDILDDAGCLFSGIGAFPKESYPADCVQRFILQWPQIQADPDMLYLAAVRTLEQETLRYKDFDPARCWISFLARLAENGVSVNPYYYDMPHELIRMRFPRLEPPACPPFNGGCLEDPPFVIPAPRSWPDSGKIRGKTLLLKSSSNCYRTAFVKRLFPAAEFRFVLLARNPLASINGMMEGWLSSGFFSQNVGGVAGLDIKGYSAPDRPWASNWWNFDLPPGWARYTNKTLEEVCAFQWLSANEQILDDAENGVFGEKLGVKYEDLLDSSSLTGEIKKILEFAGLENRDIVSGYSPARPVMAVTAPRSGKWLGRREKLLPLCAGAVKSAAEKLGYDPEEAEQWP